MTKYPDIDYDFRPVSYWDDQDVLSALLKNVKGTQRRQMITDYWEQGRLTELDAELLKDTLPEESRRRLGQIHPSFMGGEYLPDYSATEVEIARIELQSTTADVISIRAARDPKGIRYSIVDEYKTEFVLPFATSRQPLSLARLIHFLERTRVPDLEGGLPLAYNNYNCESTPPAQLRHFTTISSRIYRQLYDHFEHVYDRWSRRKWQPVIYWSPV